MRHAAAVVGAALLVLTAASVDASRPGGRAGGGARWAGRSHAGQPALRAKGGGAARFRSVDGFRGGRAFRPAPRFHPAPRIHGDTRFRGPRVFHGHRRFPGRSVVGTTIFLAPPVWWAAPWWSAPAYAAPPVIVQQTPPVYVPAPQAAPPVYWYYCQDPSGYYPYVQACPGGWLTVEPRPAPPAGGAE
jgi:hypothetical protein